MSGMSFIPILADIDDLVGIVVVVIFVGISLVGNLIKAMSEKQKKEQSAQEGSQRPPVPAQNPVSPAGAVGRVHRLPYAKAASAGPEPRPKSTLEKLEELKQKRLEQIRQQQLQQQHRPQPKPVMKPASLPSVQARPVRPTPVRQAVKPVTKAKPIPVAQPVQAAEMPVQQPGIKTPKAAVTQIYGSPIRRSIISMLKDRKMVQNTILAAEILGKPISLR
jgi:hypothetical protein